MLIIGILIALLFPAVQAARESARNVSSKNNIRQIQLAMIQHETNKGYLPPSSQFHVNQLPGNNNNDGWSILALILPYLEQNIVNSKIDYRESYKLVNNVTLANGQVVQLPSLRVPTYVSPSEPRDEVRFTTAGAAEHHPFNYAVNLGPWFVYDPVTGKGGLGSAFPNSKLNGGDFTDGMTSTLGFAEVKAWQPYFRNAGIAVPALPTVTGDVCAFSGTGQTYQETGHTEWVDGRGHHSGFTTVFPPNTQVLCTTPNGVQDVDWNNWQEGKDWFAATPNTVPTFAAITARSWFTGQVNVSMMDGSVRSISNNIHIGVWRALSTRAGKELLPEDTFK
jgi:type II secretory pathway pseudopilin PulG